MLRGDISVFVQLLVANEGWKDDVIAWNGIATSQHFPVRWQDLAALSPGADALVRSYLIDAWPSRVCPVQSDKVNPRELPWNVQSTSCKRCGIGSQVNQDARNARQGHLHMVTLAQEYRPWPQIFRKESHLER